MLEQYPVLQTYFANLGEKFKNVKKNYEKLKAINFILQAPITKLYLQVCQYILDRFNKLFQKEVGLLFLLKPRVEKMMRDTGLLH